MDKVILFVRKVLLYVMWYMLNKIILIAYYTRSPQTQACWGSAAHLSQTGLDVRKLRAQRDRRRVRPPGPIILNPGAPDAYKSHRKRSPRRGMPAAAARLINN